MMETHLPNNAHQKSHVTLHDGMGYLDESADRSRSQHLYVVLVILKCSSKVCHQSISV